jgi:hypothetical protein
MHRQRRDRQRSPIHGRFRDSLNGRGVIDGVDPDAQNIVFAAIDHTTARSSE